MKYCYTSTNLKYIFSKSHNYNKQKWKKKRIKRMKHILALKYLYTSKTNIFKCRQKYKKIVNSLTQQIDQN